MLFIIGIVLYVEYYLENAKSIWKFEGTAVKYYHEIILLSRTLIS